MSTSLCRRKAIDLSDRWSKCSWKPLYAWYPNPIIESSPSISFYTVCSSSGSLLSNTTLCLRRSNDYGVYNKRSCGGARTEVREQQEKQAVWGPSPFRRAQAALLEKEPSFLYCRARALIPPVFPVAPLLQSLHPRTTVYCRRHSHYSSSNTKLCLRAGIPMRNKLCKRIWMEKTQWLDLDITRIMVFNYILITYLTNQLLSYDIET
jgi:hypothetical protein